MIRVTVLYPNESGKRFDVDYYTHKHMTLVRDRLTGFGLVRTEVDKGLAGGAPGPGPSRASGTCTSTRSTAVQKGMAHAYEHGTL